MIVVVMASGLFLLSRQDKVYESSSTVALFPDQSNITVASLYGEMVKNLMPTYGQLIRSRSFLEDVANGLPFKTTGGALRSHVHADPVPGAGVMKIKATSPDPQRAATMAGATAQAFVNTLATNGVVRLQIIDTARVPDQPVAPKPKLVIGATVILALALAVASALLWDRMFGRVNDPKELAEATGLAVLGVVPESRALRSGARLVAGRADLIEVEESLRDLQTNLMFVMGEVETRSVAITSLSPEEGKSTICANLALMVAELGFRVLLVDADVHRPKQHELFGLDDSLGLSSLVLDNADINSISQATGFPGLRVVAAGPPLADRRREVALYQHLPRFPELADLVIVDTPPLRASADVRLLAASVGSVVLVVRSGSASVAELQEAHEALRVLDTRVFGTVLTRATKGVGTTSSAAYYGYRRAPVDQAQQKVP